MKNKSIAVAVLLAFTVAALHARGYQPGDVATDFRLKSTGGKMVSLADYSNAKGFIVVFTCNNCPYALAYEDRILALDKKYAPLGYPVIAINPNDPVASPADTYELMQKRANDKKYTFPYLVDEGQQVYPQYGATKTPHIYILQKEKKNLVVRYTGTIDNNYKDAADVDEKYVEAAVDALLSGKPVAMATTAAIGCGIKVKK